jgi:hypothetical protein
VGRVSKHLDPRAILKMTSADLMELPPPGELDWDGSTIGVNAQVTSVFLEAVMSFLLIELADDDITSDEFDGAFTHLVTYYDCALTQILSCDVDERLEAAEYVEDILCLDLDTLLDRYGTLDQLASEGSDVAESQLFALLIWMTYSACATMSAPLYLWPGSLTAPRRRMVRYEGFKHTERMFEWLHVAKNTTQRQMGQHLMSSALAMFARALEEEPVSLASEVTPVFSRLQVNDLPLLARREAAALGHYRSIEHALEDQLELLFVSLGFGVGRARPGVARADLTCVSGANPAFSMLVDAKSSKHAYGLPVSESRALEEYVSELKEAPINGFAPLETLELRARVQCRVIRAEQLSRLRQSIVGPLDARRFLKLCLESEREVGSDAISALIVDTRERETLQTTIESLIGRTRR